jgi:thiamine biosynthesis lipoprotein
MTGTRASQPGTTDMDRVVGSRRIVAVMGTVFSLDVRDLDPASVAVDEVVSWWRWVDDTFSTYRTDSALSQLADGRLRLPDCPDELAEVLSLCEEMSQVSNGYFSAYPHGRLDPTGLVKGWSVEAAIQMLRASGSTRHCIAAGGDIRCADEAAPNSPWRLGIVDPFNPQRLAAVVEGNNLAVATSGSSERGLHIINPRTGRPANELASLTLVGSDLTRVDALATAAFAMGPSSKTWLLAQPELECLIVGVDGERWTSPDFPGTVV